MDSYYDGARWFLCTDWAPWTEVTLDQWLKAERDAGFRVKGGHNGPATGGFSGGGVKGRIVWKSTKPTGYDWDPDFQKAVWPDGP